MKVYIYGPSGPDGRGLEKTVRWYGPWMGMSRATYVTRGEKGDNPVHFNHFRERIQGGQKENSGHFVVETPKWGWTLQKRLKVKKF